MANETTTKFKVDISELKKNIQEANRQIRLANAEFKAASAGMDDWSKSADGLTAKIEQQEKVLKSQKAILSDYEKQLVLIEQQYGKDSKEADEMRIKIANQTAAVKNTEKSIQGYQSELKNLDSTLDETEKTVEKTNDGFSVFKGVISDLVASGIKAAVSALKDLASAAKDAFKEFDTGRDTIIAKTGATGDAAEELMGVYKNVSRSVVGDFDDIGDAVGELNTRFGVTGKDLETLSTKFVKFSKLNGTDMSGTIDDVQKAMNAFGLSSDKASEVLDALNKVGQDTGISISALTKGLVQNGTAFQEMGLNISQSAALMGQMEKSGANSETVMNGLRKALSSSTKGGVSLSQALDDLEKNIVNSDDSISGLQAAYDAFGKSGDQIYGALKSGALSFKDISIAADDYANSVDNTYENTQDASDKVTLAFQNMKVSLGETVDDILKRYGPDITKAIEDITPTIQNIVSWIAEKIPVALDTVKKAFESVAPYVKTAFSWITENKDAVIAAIVGIGTAFAAWKIVSFIQNIGTLGTALKGLWVVISANPVGLIVSAIAALVAAFIYLWNNCDEFRQFWLDLWDEIQKVASAVVEAVAEFFIGLWDDIKSAWSAVTGFFTGIWDEIKKSASNLVESVAKFFTGMWDGLKNGAKAAWEGIKSVFGSIADWFKDKFSKAWQAVKDVFSTGGKIFDGIKDGIVSAFKTVVNAIIRGINKVIALPFDGINAVLEKIKNVSILGYQPFDWIGQLPVPQIPELKRGGVLRRGQIGLLEGNGAEAVVPLENNKKWIHSTANDLRKSLAEEGIIGGSGSSGTVTTTYNFNQVNNSPKALSRLEIYRQSKNLLALQGV